jgi:hypothetical protein
MFKKTMTFDNLEGEEVSQTFYFNYNKKEIAELLEFGRVLRFKRPGESDRLPLEQQLELLKKPTEESGLTEQQNTEQAYKIFQDLILDAYGRKSDDNVTFVKNWELRDYWESHVAFVELIFEFLADTRLAMEFIEKCLPEKLMAQAKAEMEREAATKVTDADIEKLVEEGAQRQANPETAIAPGPGPAPEPVKTDGLTDAEILAKDPKDLTQPQLLRAFKLKNDEKNS